jgi:putative transposase
VPDAITVARGDTVVWINELLREISRSLEMTIYVGAINRDHVHMLLGIRSL